MPKMTLGRTRIQTEKNGFGALPIQRMTAPEAAKLLQKAFDHGIRFFDSARSYTDSEEKIGLALSSVRKDVFLATKTPAKDAQEFWRDLETSLRLLKTDYLDLYQFHNPAFCPKPGEENGLYAAMLKARQQGKIRFIGLTNHRLFVAREAVHSGLYDTLQFPFSYLATEKEAELVSLCEQSQVGFLAMKALCGGLIMDVEAAYAFIANYPQVLPLWGLQREAELEALVALMQSPPTMTPAVQARITADRRQLSGSFCRGCGYCLPCPAEIDIPTCARMSLLLRRSPSGQWLEPRWQEKMGRISHCTGCGHCKAQCPYGLNTPELLGRNGKDYQEVLQGKPL